MAINLKEVSLDGLRIILPALSTQKLFDASVAIHHLMRAFEKIHTREADLLQNEFVRKASIIENELRNRCVTKKITEKRKRGIKINNIEKISYHSDFRRFLRDYIEKEIKKIHYVKRK